MGVGMPHVVRRGRVVDKQLVMEQLNIIRSGRLPRRGALC